MEEFNYLTYGDIFLTLYVSGWYFRRTLTRKGAQIVSLDQLG